ncbi:MAG TPA: ATP/GTP-binding protein [Actinomycetota bacterium]|nr:ATP/GTP-binding protein [Actinomycetota bacterium]
MRRQRPESAAARPLKIVVTGPFAAGKTSLIQTISDVTVLGTERPISDHTSSGTKDSTTVAMDFGRIQLGGPEGRGPALFLFGTPGQERFDVMWEVLSEGMIGFVLLVNAADDRSAEQAVAHLDTFRRYADVPFVVGVTHLDAPGASLPAVRERLGLGDGVPVVACDPRSREDVKGLMLRILFGVLERLDAAEGAEPVAVSS